MTKPEAMKIVCVLFGSFPNARFNEQNFESYAEGILDLDAGPVGKAAQRLIRTNKFLPSIAELREAATAQQHGPKKTGAEAYGELLDAVRRHGSKPAIRVRDDGRVLVQTPWPPLADDVAQAMRQTWGSWSDCCHAPDAQEMADRARFIAAYDGLAERERQDLVSGQALPAPGDTRTRLPAPRATQVAKPGADASTRRLYVLVASVGNGPQKTNGAVAGLHVASPTAAAAAPAELVPRRWSAEEIDAALRNGGSK